MDIVNADMHHADVILSVSNLTVRIGTKTILSRLNLNAGSGSMLYVTGANGSGKTTLLKALAGLTETETGEILWKGTPTQKSVEYKSQMAYLAHKNGLNGDILVGHNLEYASLLSGKTTPSEAAQAVKEALRTVGLEKHAGRPLRHLSQGQQRRVALARLLLQRARLWLMDEPFNALDGGSIERFCSVLAGHLARGGMAVASTHQAIPLAAQRVATVTL